MSEFVEGVCSWFASGGQSFGYIKYGGGEIYVHYKNITKIKQRDPRYREIKCMDKVKFKVGEGYRNTGTQALEVEILSYGFDNDKT